MRFKKIPLFLKQKIEFKILIINNLYYYIKTKNILPYRDIKSNLVVFCSKIDIIVEDLTI